MNFVTISGLINHPMRSAVSRKSFLLFVFWIVSTVGFAQLEVPPLAGKRVHDEAGVLSGQTIQNLEYQLKLHQDSTGNQIAILILKSLNGESLEEYSIHVAHDEWKLGSEKNDNGVLLLIAIDDRKMRIEVGQGLEGVLTDALCSQIIRNEMAPEFRRGDYDAGVLLATNAIIQAIAGEYTAEQTVDDNSSMSVSERIFISLFIFGILGVFTLGGLRTKGAGGWVLYAFLTPFYALFPHVAVGYKGGVGILIAYIIGYPILRTIFKRKGWQDESSNNRGSGGGGWSSGSGWFSSGGGSSWGGGGGFSGGGGSFGGGGSSGSW
ncbi:MAG TPA: TPM domain-containing protein [Cyclobacteriaceae bacterium]|nr:TPM domain-containing protein [Cyclobacteriaceae bacterium]HMV07850.1 TPM domain-containing protein [Cyclobacteriaceae bacterium]HMV88118.1 TPM domain-containing protein [Cyclobacteriaceae bacterium]HMW98984.1 TPM domain-containing protein [Cyclobacteriaceae bacterium]HMX48382.1 TPM domain-containing protein [Cyclobacteriaceae bacterium]